MLQGLDLAELDRTVFLRGFDDNRAMGTRLLDD